ncbi:MAG: hypothetical protein NT080_04930 [Spirochaetes bacterium]|nr:hypothetical protein [Spirochaetota bacterium]
MASAIRKKGPAFPRKELDTWLTTHTTWTHDQWMALLADLRGSGYTELCGGKEGQDRIGLYLETNKKK